MLPGELNLDISSTSPQVEPSAPAPEPEEWLSAPAPAPVEPPEALAPPRALADYDLPPLPSALENVGKSLASALAANQQVAQAFATFCSAAYVKPEWAGAASDFLAELFAEHEDLLAEFARIPDLIIELASGHATLTCMVAARWAARAETQRLARLAEALIATQSKMAGTTAVVEVMLALATSLAITRYSRAEQLLNAAEPQATEEHQEALAEVLQWLAAGRIVRSCSQEIRDLWDQRLRRSRQVWTWESAEEREALLQLSTQLEDGLEGMALFEAVIPTAWWDLARSIRTKERGEPEPLVPIPQAFPQLRLPPSFAAGEHESAHEHEHDNLPDLPWNPMAFIAGTLLGAMSLTGFIWLAQPRWISRAHVSARSAASSPANADRPSAATATTSSSPATGASSSDVAPSSTGLGAATQAGTTPASASPSVDAAPSPPPTEWRATALEELTKEAPELAPLAAAAKQGSWTENETVLKGESVTALRSSPSYQKLLLWLHLDPPTDQEVRAKIPALLVELRADEPVLDLWKKLVYEGSPNATDIRNAAKQQIHSNAEAWTIAQRNTLMEIAGWGVASSAH